MKRNILSDNNNSGKSSKGFYAALGISAVMIGSACFFAYNQSDKINEAEKLTAENSQNEAVVDNKVNNIPRTTLPPATTVVTTTAPKATTTAVTTTIPTATLPAAAIVTAVPPVSENKEAQTDKLANVSAPLADMSKILSPFSGTELVKSETTGSWQTHNGTDYAASVGSEVFAISPGEVTAVNEDPLWGITVVIDHHNGYISRYCGLAPDLSVQLGDKVVSGDSLGAVGDTIDIESALEPHLHIEIMKNGKYIDPASALAK